MVAAVRPEEVSSVMRGVGTDAVYAYMNAADLLETVRVDVLAYMTKHAPPTTPVVGTKHPILCRLRQAMIDDHDELHRRILKIKALCVAST